VTHLLVTNDFPPKVGGIQVYLWELWRRLDPDRFVVVTASSHPDAERFDLAAAQAGIRIERLPGRVLLPSPATAAAVRQLVAKHRADLVVVDPALPLGLLGPVLGVPYALVLHGAEVTVPARLPAARLALARVLAGASLAICAGGYPEAEARRAAGDRMPPVLSIPPGVDVERFRPLRAAERRAARQRLGLPAGGALITSVSRLVPRKGMDVLIAAADALVPSYPGLTVAIGGAGRDRRRIERLAARSATNVVLLGRVADADLPALVGCGDVFAMLCRSRWGGLEAEGFGIVFLEAAACGVPQVAGRSGGAAEAVVHGQTGLVVDRPRSAAQTAQALRSLLADDTGRRRLGRAARQRAEASFAYDVLARRLGAGLEDVGG
jgi:phosphatidylinositol alpha-1,6-mannosyltransferase